MTLFKIVIPNESRVLLLEDSPMRVAWFEKRCPHIKVCNTVKEFREYFDARPIVDFIFYDHDLGEAENGVDAAKFVREMFGGKCKWGLIHSWNEVGARAMQAILPNTPYIKFGDFDLEVEQ